MPNPYEPIDSSFAKRANRRNRKAVVSIVLGAISLVLASPGLFLFNQDYWQIIPISTGINSIEFNGNLVANNTVIAYSIASAGGLLGASLYFGASAFLERYKNDF